MTIIKKTISLAVIVLLLFFIIAFFWVRYNGKMFIESRASAIFNRGVTVEDVEFMFPLGVRLYDLNVSGLLFAPEARVQFGVTAFLNRSFELNDVVLTAPVLTLHRAQDNSIVWEPHAVSGAEGVSTVTGATTNAIKLVIRSLSVINGKILFPGHDDQGEMDVFLQDVKLTANDVPLSGQPLDTVFDAALKIVGDDVPFSGNIVHANGTINWPARNMDAVLKILNPQGKADLQVKLTSRNNDMKVEGRVTSAGVMGSSPAKDPSVGNVLIDTVKTSGMALEMGFSFPTKMDKWELRNIEFSGNLSPSKSAESAAE